MKFIDLHCDTLLEAYWKKQDDIYETDTMLDIKRMKSSGCIGQFFAIFMPGPGSNSYKKANGIWNDEEYIEFCFKTFENTVSKHGDIAAKALSGSDILKNEAQGKTSAFLTFEDGRAIDGKMEKLEEYFKRGIRLISLTWNGENCFGFPNSADKTEMEKGLKPFGKDAVKRMNELGIIIDVSHLSAGGFFDVAKLSGKPFIASHSNCLSLGPHQRNLSDEQLRILASAGGVAGLNYCPLFLSGDIHGENSTAVMISAHAKYMKKIAGIDSIALGSDFDGISGKLEISDIEKVPLLFDQLKSDGFSDDEIEKIAWKNALRVITEITG
jgi:membrane dipeptidase